MAIDRSNWQTRIDDDFSTSYPCPRCKDGRVRRGENEVDLDEPNYSRRMQKRNEWEPDWTQMTFSTKLVCDKTTCGEVVAVSGCAGLEYRELHGYDGEPGDYGFYTWLQPINMFPAPPLFPISQRLPPEVKKELKLAFQLFWVDRSASTSRLRTSLERVLDDKGIATNSSPNEKGKARRLPLHERIDLFQKATKDEDTAESMTAMRVVGNLGTHGDEVSLTEYFDLLDVYEDALAELYEQKTAKLKAKKLALIELKNC